jgi:hypothetical protein
MDPATLFPAAPPSGTGLRLRHAMAGLQAGVLGALVMLACLMVGSLMNRRSIWVAPNLFATSFYGAGVYYNHYAGTAWSGVALLIVMYGGLGALWGCAWREEQKPWLAVYGAIFGMVVYFFLFDFVWKQVNGIVILYAPSVQLQVGHALWGMILSNSPKYARRIAGRMQDLTTAGQTPGLTEPAMSSGPGAG